MLPIPIDTWEVASPVIYGRSQVACKFVANSWTFYIWLTDGPKWFFTFKYQCLDIFAKYAPSSKHGWEVLVGPILVQTWVNYTQFLLTVPILRTTLILEDIWLCCTNFGYLMFVLRFTKNIIFSGWWFGTSILFSHINWVANHPNWRAHIFQRGG